MKKFFVLGIVLILSLGFFGCDSGGDSDSLWWEGRYPITTFNGYTLPPGQWVAISTAGLSNSNGDYLRATIYTQDGGDVLDGTNVIGTWVYIISGGVNYGLALNITKWTKTGQTLALGDNAVSELYSDLTFYGIDLDNPPPSSIFSKIPYDCGLYWVYSSRLN